MKPQEQLMHLTTTKYLFILILIAGAFVLEFFGFYELSKEHLYYIILLFLFAELFYGMFYTTILNKPIFNIWNLIIIFVILLTFYLAWRERNKKQYVEFFDLDEDAESESEYDEYDDDDNNLY